MKKYLILAVVTLLAVLLSACSGNVKSNDTSAENTTTQVSTSVNETVQTTNAELPKIYNPTNVEIRDNEDENKVIIESSQIEYVCLLDDINGMVLNMKLTADGTDKFADYTKNNIGNMHMADGKRQVAGSVAVDDDDVAAFAKLRDLGVELEIRRVPTEGAENIEKLFK